VKLWHAPARALPVTVRPIGGETIVSYARRLSAVNDLPPTAILRALGQFTNTGSGKHLLICDARLSEHAAGRLEAYTGIPRTRLARALPALRGPLHPGQELPPNRPALSFRRAHPRSACRHCQLAASGPSGPGALVLPGWIPLLCRRHRRWLGLEDETLQRDPSPARDILAAGRRLAGLLARSGDHAWAYIEFLTAWNIAQHWTECEPRRMPIFSQRWRDRATALGITKTGKHPPRVVTFPEAVTLAAILTDMDWRRNVALAWIDDSPFYQHIAESIGERSYPRWWIANDPVPWWIRHHRARFERLRHWSLGKPPPENRHFK
jgi:hypothetical protein